MFVFRKLFAFLAPYDCLVCGLEGDIVCMKCLPCLIKPPILPKLSGLDRVWAVGLYEGSLQSIVHAYKFERGVDIAQTLAFAMHLMAPAMPAEMIVTYVPTASSRIRERGYDQSARLAKAFASYRGLYCVPLLRRHGQARQLGASRRLRQRQLREAYTPKNTSQIKHAHILLIDDVLTTGTSLGVTANILRQAGCRQVDGLVVAYKK